MADAEHSEPTAGSGASGDPAAAGFVDQNFPQVTVLDAPILWEGKVLGKFHLTHKVDGRVFTADDDVTLEAVADAVGMTLHYATEIEEARRGRQWLEAAGDVGTALLGDGDPERVLGVIARHAQVLSASDTALVLLPSDSGLDQVGVTDLRIAVCAGAGADILLDLMIPVAGSTSGAVLADRTPRKVDATYRRAGLPIAFGPAMAVPLTPSDTGSVLMVMRVPGAALFNDDDLARLAFFAENAALALHLAETQRLRELGVLAARDRLARELYDHLMQQLFAVGLAMQITCGRSGSTSDTRMGEHVDQVQSVIQDVRQAIFDLPVAGVTSPQVRTSLAHLITSLTVDSPQAVNLRMTGPLDALPADLAEHARTVLSEAVGNAVRHSHADELTINVTVYEDLVLDISDNGLGIGNAGEGPGLARLHQLATDMAGTFTVEEPETGGTRVLWTAPLP